MEAEHPRSGRTKRSLAGVEISRSGALAKLERISSPKPRRNKDALCKAAGATPHGAGLRPPSCRDPGPDCRAERLHRARHTRHRGRRISLSRDRGSSAITRFAQQSRNSRHSQHNYVRSSAPSTHAELCDTTTRPTCRGFSTPSAMGAPEIDLLTCEPSSACRCRAFSSRLSRNRVLTCPCGPCA
jgi:hypothetical protein